MKLFIRPKNVKELERNGGAKSTMHEKLDQLVSDAIIKKIVRGSLKQAGDIH